MKKTICILVIILLVIGVGVLGISMLNTNNNNGTVSSTENQNTNVMPDDSEEEATKILPDTDPMAKLVNSIYEKTEFEMMALETREVALKDEMVVKSYTGLSDLTYIDRVVASESMITSSAYSLVLVNLKDDADIESIKKEMVDNINMRKWICVGADVVYATNSENTIFLVMGNEEDAKKQYDAYKEIVNNNIGKELQRQAEVLDF